MRKKDNIIVESEFVEIVSFYNGFYGKDKNGVVWQILKTPFNEVPKITFKEPIYKISGIDDNPLCGFGTSV